MAHHSPPSSPGSFLGSARAEAELVSRVIAADPLVSALFNAVPSPTVILNRDGRIVAVNPQFLALARRPPGDLLGLRLGEALGCDHPEHCDGIVSAALPRVGINRAEELARWLVP